MFKGTISNCLFQNFTFFSKPPDFLHINGELHYNNLPIQQPGIDKVQECQIDEMITLLQVRFMKKKKRRMKMKKRRNGAKW